ncbi:PEP-CTERM sorting domain-containing protein [Roseisolibacter agri]|uniref:Ice-binding protein C-terminal domain-containing protein n=1 Tax=Roseisolibacter agri TaxID=2014610 RepID=A0AA37Q1W1_9BACT|nr:PEP-CTERM sorting domain-containing protein [Roseisolibacter agri]GLC24849.1 hypothetical protein rosag_13620 [Roseisolibacter agri]
MRPTVYLSSAAAALLTLAGAPAAHAQQIATRTDLAAILGASMRVETFDDVTDPARGVYATTTHGSQPGQGLALTSETNMRDRGPGLIEPGIAFTNPNNGHWFWPTGWGSYGNTSTVYAAGHHENDITFTSPTRAFGVDLFVFAGQPIATTLTFFDVGGQLIGSTTLRPTPGQFVGWQHEAGIGRVHFSGGSNDAVSVRMDNVTFGAGAAAPVTTTPEPATFALLGGGLAAVGVVARRRRREA